MYILYTCAAVLRVRTQHTILNELMNESINQSNHADRFRKQMHTSRRIQISLAFVGSHLCTTPNHNHNHNHPYLSFELEPSARHDVHDLSELAEHAARARGFGRVARVCVLDAGGGGGRCREEEGEGVVIAWWCQM